MFPLLFTAVSTGSFALAAGFRQWMDINKRCLTPETLLKSKVIVTYEKNVDVNYTKVAHRRLCELAELSRQHGARLLFSPNMSENGHAYRGQNTIVMGIRDLLDVIPLSPTISLKPSHLTSFYHELGHLRARHVPEWCKLCIFAGMIHEVFNASPLYGIAYQVCGFGVLLLCCRYNEAQADKYMFNALKDNPEHMELWRNKEKLRPIAESFWSRLTHPRYTVS